MTEPNMLYYIMYNAKVAVLLAAFYLFYRLLLSRESLHRLNRIVLLSTCILSFILPLCIITLHHTVTVDLPTPTLQPDTAVEAPPTTLSAQEEEGEWWHAWVVTLYWSGVLIALGRMLVSLTSMLRMIRQAKNVRQCDGYRLIIDERDTPSFSWMNYMVISRTDYERGLTSIIEHEKAHIMLHHSWDVLLVDVLAALQWFNPCVWMLRMDLRAIHEYEADEQVLRLGTNVREYQYLLVSKAMETCPFRLANNFNHNDLKGRLRMMGRKNTSALASWRVLYILPIAALSLLASARTVTDYRRADETRSLHDNSTSSPTPETLMMQGEQRKENEKQGEVSDAERTETNDTLSVSSEGTHAGTKDDQSALTANTELVDAWLAMDKGLDQNRIYDVCTKESRFEQGDAGCYQYVKRSVRYPEAARRHGVKGRVFVRFVVEPDGSLTNITVLSNRCSTELDDVTDNELEADRAALTQEAIRLTHSMSGMWQAGEIRGVKVRSWFNLPIMFSPD